MQYSSYASYVVTIMFSVINNCLDFQQILKARLSPQSTTLSPATVNWNASAGCTKPLPQSDSQTCGLDEIFQRLQPQR